MTVLAVVKTASDVVFAADSRIATQWFERIGDDGRPVLATQTFELGRKLVVSRSGGLACAVAGSIGRWETPMDFFAARSFFADWDSLTVDGQDEEVHTACARLAELRDTHLSASVRDASAWPETLVLLAAAHPTGGTRVWRLVLRGREPTLEEVLHRPGILVEGGSDVASLLDGVHPALRGAVGPRGGVMRPIDRINVAAMPVQDAADLAHFLASVQVNMDRFVAGQDACGGPIDLAVVHGLPRGAVTWLPGKTLHHPGDGHAPKVA